MNAYLVRKKKELETINEQITVLEALETRSESQENEYKALIAQGEAIVADFQSAQGLETKAFSISEALAGFSVSQPRAQRDGPPSTQQRSEMPQRFSDRVAQSAEYKANRWSEGISLGGDLLQLLKHYGADGLKAAWVPTGLNLGGGPVQVIGPRTPRPRYRLLDLVPTTPWGNLAVPYVAPAFTNNAAIVAMGAAKPESTNAGNILSAVMQTIAHFKDIPRQLLRYLPGLRQALDDELISGAEEELTDEMINGDGTTGHLLGFLTAVTATGTGDDLVSATLSGIGLVEAAGGTVDGVVFNAGDYWALQALAYADNKFAPIIANGQFFGIPAVTTSKLAAGKSLVGDFARGSRLYDGEQANVRTAEPRAKENIVTLIGELDAVLVIARPNYFAENTAPLVAEPEA